MSGRHRNDFPEGTPGDGEHDAPGSRPVFGPANDGSSAWFGPRDSQGSPATPPSDRPVQGQQGPGQPAGPGQPGPGQPGPGQPGPGQPSPGQSPSGYDPSGQYPSGGPAPGQSSETPEWFTSRGSREESVYGQGGFTGASDAGGYGLGRSYGDQQQPPRQDPYGESGAFAGRRDDDYDAISRSDESPTGFFGGKAGGSGGSGGYGGSGSYGGSGEFSRRKKKRRASALIGPMAGAVGLMLLLGVGVYAFAESGGDCGGDDAITLAVAAAPDIEPAVVKAAGRFNDAKHKVGGKCVKANVARSEPSAVATLLSGQGVPSGGDQRPDVWIPDSSLWTSLVRGSPKGRDAVQTTKTSVAASPIVVGLPRTLANQLKQQGITATPSWDNLLKAAGGVAGGGVTKNQMIPPNAVRLLVPEPTRNAAGMGSLMITSALLTNDPARESIFTGIVRTVRESTAPTQQAQFAQFRKGRTGRQPVSLSSEQALYTYNKRSPQEPAVALYPREGTLLMDYPFAVTSGDGDKQKAARLLEQAMNTETTRSDVRELGFRSPDGKAPGGFSARYGVSAARPRQLPQPKPAEVTEVMQAWAKIALGLRMLTLIDVSGSMAEKVSPTATRMQATAQIAQGGLSMMSNDTELGVWLFSTKLQGDRDYREAVSVGPLGERIGSITRRNLVLSQMNQMRPKPDGDTGLYDSVLAAYRHMKRTYKAEFGNSILLLTDGANDDPGGPTLNQTIAALKKEQDPNRPIQINMIGFGKGVDPNELKKIADVTNGSVQVAQTPQEISKIFLLMLARRMKE
ncbi:VWA domain-containing protein [Actinomadura hibisca]|uniref:VWA domain-containing protein n=1 Tax=Actinomadura hibisca TaxID=68565 RepID=UPI0008329ED0|nr:substrate-binding domain-containing protein [Actinomadura hibisca]